MEKNRIVLIEVAYASAHEQCLIQTRVPENCTIAEAIRLSGICDKFPEINLDKQKVGIFSKPRQLTDVVRNGDRIEIYRRLLIDPKEARRAKAKKTSKRN